MKAYAEKLEDNKMNNQKLLDCIATLYTTFDDYLALIEQCDDLNIKRTYYDGGFSGMLHLAVSNKKWDVAEDLIKRGIDVNMQDDNGNTVLHFIAAQPINIEIAEKILMAGGNPNIENRWEVTPLYSIVCNNNRDYREQKYELMKLFMKYGGDAEQEMGKSGSTSIQMAHEFADCKMIEILEGR